MSYINPLFNNSDITNKKPVYEKDKPVKRQMRAPRKDKTHSIKFPVTVPMQMKLKSYCKQAARINKHLGKVPLTQTKFNNQLLRFGLKHENILRWDFEYIDTKNYMHTNILEIEYEELGGPHGYSVRKSISDRKAVFFIIQSVLKWLEGEGSLEKVL